jgi:DNA-binding NtrC family response regulator
MAQATAVVLDSDQHRRDDIRIRLSRCGVLPICFKDEWTCLENIHHIRPAFAVLQPDSREAAIRFVNIAKAVRSTFPVIVLSNQREIENFVHSHWLVNLFFLHYPADERDFQGTIRRLAGSKPNPGRPVLIAVDPESQRRMACLPLLASSREPLWIQGEAGVGKRLLAASVVNCMTSGASEPEYMPARNISTRWIRDQRRRVDRPRAAKHPVQVCVIENIEALPVGLQAQLLPILEAPAVGSGAGGRPAVRFISLAEPDVVRLIRQGRFRQDLYHRLSVLKLSVPPLRHRREDVPALADFFAAQTSIRHRGAIVRLPDAVRRDLKHYPWPGNVAELKGAIARILARDVIDWAAAVPGRGAGPVGATRQRRPGIDLDEDLRRFLKNNPDLSLKNAKRRFGMQVESRIMQAALVCTRGNCKKAAGLLNISYKSMLNKVKDYRLV